MTTGFLFGCDFVPQISTLILFISHRLSYAFLIVSTKEVLTMKALLISLVIGLATSPMALAEKPNWAGEGKPSKEAVEQHAEEMMQKHCDKKDKECLKKLEKEQKKAAKEKGKKEEQKAMKEMNKQEKEARKQALKEKKQALKDQREKLEMEEENIEKELKQLEDDEE
ncbi:hypothetical protein FORC9_4195 [Vibrio vulnificus]|nr:hypothetical protein FORC9_4195 [Vibrio vulnificus]